MILYSIVPAELVFSNPAGNQEQNMLEMDYMGEKVQVTPLENNRYVLQRLISSSPKAFLNPAFQPGKVIEKDERR